MDTNKVNEYASWFTAFLHDQPIVVALLLAAVISWTLTAAAKPWVADGPKKKRNLRTLDVCIAALVSAILLFGHVDWRLLIGLSLFIGGGSPFGYFLFSEAMCWKWPSLRKYLSLRELAPDPDPTDQAGV